jgi:catalase/peroxidase HPI
VVISTSQESWPADYGTYGPLFVRLAWHNAGSYRASDGRGGADGARQRFDPERSWEDNTNLDKARSLLWPIKQKYGVGLSWGDLIVLTGNTAIENMGGPILGFCGGRIDDPDGSESELLGPSFEQQLRYPCDINGKCKKPLGSSTVGLIYLNPEGPMGQPIPEHSANEIRDTFGRMNMNDSETVALIGGGHSFGKAHGACAIGAGKPPKEDPINPWPGMCGSGRGEDAYTSGFEFPWTKTPTKWNTEYFQNLVVFSWKVGKGPGDRFQWRAEGISPHAPSANGTHRQNIGMLTSDVALLRDPVYTSLVKKWATNEDDFNHAFKHAWYKLTTRDMGPISRCIGSNVPPPQDWQYPLPDAPTQMTNFERVKAEIRSVIEMDRRTKGMFVRLAWQCISSFRSSDYLGGCNGARIKYKPQIDWPVNKNINDSLAILGYIKDGHNKKNSIGISMSDLIVLAGNTALEVFGGKMMTFCGGRTDAVNGEGWENLFPRITGKFNETIHDLHEFVKLMGVTVREYAALHGAGYAIGQTNECYGLYCQRDNHVSDPVLSNCFFTVLLSNEWKEDSNSKTGEMVFKSVGNPNLSMYKVDVQFKYNAELLAISQDYASDNQLFLNNFASAWTKLANADRFDGPFGNLCE